jgi:hypothetical protein
MGLKNFHVVFVIASMLICFGFAAWCFATEPGRQLAGSTPIGAFTIVVGIALGGYLLMFRRKLQREGL